MSIQMCVHTRSTHRCIIGLLKEKKSAGAGYLPKGKLWGKKTSLGEWWALGRAQEKKKTKTLEEGAGTSGRVQECY